MKAKIEAEIRYSNILILEALMDMTEQHCYRNSDGDLYSGGLSANELALETIERYGYLQKSGKGYALNWFKLSAEKEKRKQMFEEVINKGKVKKGVR